MRATLVFLFGASKARRPCLSEWNCSPLNIRLRFAKCFGGSVVRIAFGASDVKGAFSPVSTVSFCHRRRRVWRGRRGGRSFWYRRSWNACSGLAARRRFSQQSFNCHSFPFILFRHLSASSVTRSFRFSFRFRKSIDARAKIAVKYMCMRNYVVTTPGATLRGFNVNAAAIFYVSLSSLIKCPRLITCNLTLNVVTKHFATTLFFFLRRVMKSQHSLIIIRDQIMSRKYELLQHTRRFPANHH